MILGSSKVKLLLVAVTIVAVVASVVVYSAGRIIARDVRFHYFEVSAVKIPQIKLEVIYFVPADMVPRTQFSEVLGKALADIQAFHLREFRGLSALRYVLYPEAVVGRETTVYYEEGGTARGNPDALPKIIAELGKRMYRVEGDLYKQSFATRKSEELPIKIIVYQGVGASSGVLSVIVSYDYFTKTGYGATTLYHEILHNLGVPDAYDYLTDVPHADDIMGAGRTKPLMETYVRDEIRKKLTE